MPLSCVGWRENPGRLPSPAGRSCQSSGTVKKDRFEPAHALALWLHDCGCRCSYGADSSEIRMYLHGDVLPSGQKGWCLVCADGFSLGWAKGDGKQLKNHYPKGLRK